jgi:hypothetical protein
MNQAMESHTLCDRRNRWVDASLYAIGEKRGNVAELSHWRGVSNLVGLAARSQQ